ncbi:MAG TPA: tetratricopeptide repeat protein, partial [Candidatus Deferrimicrobium sp.]|nr:tetratricopeptide repeat protein [Candidatus Deferrimicrobium sp.]
AFAFAVLQDSLGGRTGQPLLHFMRTCQERKHFQQVARMGEYALGRFRQNGFPADAHFVYADALVHLGRYTDAIGVYDTVVASFPVMADKAEALYQIGDVYLNYLHDYDRALTCFDSVIGEYNTGLGFLNSILARPHCVLRQGRLPEARDAFTKLLSRRLSPDQSEMATYHLALIMFFEHTFDSSEIAFRKLQVDYPRGFYVNDALQLLLVMSEAKDQPALLKEFSDALLFEQRHMPDSTANRLRALADKPGGLLADLALYKLALLSLSQSDSAAAVAYVDRLAQQFAESYYLPYGMKVKADIFVSRPDGIEPAKALYQALLEKYPNYPFISEVRKRLRQLEGEA